MTIELLHDPANGELPGILSWRHEKPTVTDFHTQPGGWSGVRCKRCNADLNVHVWQLVDPEPTEEALIWQGGVIDCGILE